MPIRQAATGCTDTPSAEIPKVPSAPFDVVPLGDFCVARPHTMGSLLFAGCLFLAYGPAMIILLGVIVPRSYLFIFCFLRCVRVKARARTGALSAFPFEGMGFGNLSASHSPPCAAPVGPSTTAHACHAKNTGSCVGGERPGGIDCA